MQINVSTRHGHISPETREKIVDKVTRLTRAVSVASLLVTLDLEREDDPWVEVTVKVDRHEDFVAHDRAGSLWASVDSVLDKAAEQLRRYKDRMRDHNKTSHKRVELPEQPGVD